jgi:glycosyltransferase involved in cell wall biosynthesis
LYGGADVFVLSSKSEGWGRVLLEAAAAHLPIITTDVGLIGEVLFPEKDVIVYPTGDIEALALALESVITDPVVAKKRAGHAWKSVQGLPTNKERIMRYVACWKHAIDIHQKKI